MNKAEYTKMYELEDDHFWFVGKRYLIDSVLEKYSKKITDILDLGSGTGGLTKHLKKYGIVTGVEMSDYAIKLAKKRGVVLKKGDINSLKDSRSSYDLVTLFDVLYHQNIENENAVLKKIRPILKKNGLLLITDSALNFLKSYHDEAVHGRTRYTRSGMEALVKKSGYKILKSSYFYFSIFPLVLINRFVISKLAGKKASDVAPINRIVNLVLLTLIKLEAKFLKYISFPIGSSVVILAVKK